GDDGGGFGGGEPIAARPVGPLQWAWKWVKRNKVVAGAMAAVLLALSAGTGVSIGFALEAQKQAEEARRKQKDADDAAAREEQEKRDAILARNEVQQKSDELKRMLAKALLGPITTKNHDNALTPHEVETFWQMAELRR